MAIYREFSEGVGSDLHWVGMKAYPTSSKILGLPSGVSRSATAHSVAGGKYTIRAALVHDLNRYNDRAFKDDQREIGRATMEISIGARGAALR